MTTASDLLVRAYREANIKNVVGTLTTEEQTEGLALLQSLVDSLIPMVVGTKLMPWYVPRPQKTANVAANYPAYPGDAGIISPHDVTLPPSNVRLFMKNPQATTVQFQYQPEDGAVVEYIDTGHTGDVTLDANGAIFGATGSNTQVIIVAQFPAGRNAPRRWLYRGDVGAWVEVITLALASEMPYPSAFDDYFVTALAIRLSPRFSAEPRSVTVMRFQQMETFIRLQYLQTKEQVIGNAGVPTDQAYLTQHLGYQDFNGGGI